MSRLIDADELFKNGIKINDDINLPLLLDVVNQIRKAPTIDAVPVVRCKDCIHAYINSFSAFRGVCLCKRLTNKSEGIQMIMRQDDFCSYGERKEEKE